jgi:hypothetical protein
MVEVDAPAVFGNKALADKVLTVGIYLKPPRRPTTGTAGKYNANQA